MENLSVEYERSTGNLIVAENDNPHRAWFRTSEWVNLEDWQ